MRMADGRHEATVHNCQLLSFSLRCFSGWALQGHAVSGLQVNWQMLWADKRKRAGMRVLGWIVLAFAVLFPVGIFTGERAQVHAAPESFPHTKGSHAVPDDILSVTVQPVPVWAGCDSGSTVQKAERLLPECCVCQREPGSASRICMAGMSGTTSAASFVAARAWLQTLRPLLAMAAGAVTQVQTLVCQNAAFADNPYCKSRSIWKGIMTAVLPPLLLTLWQNMCMPQLVYRGAQVSLKWRPLSERFPAAIVILQRRA